MQAEISPPSPSLLLANTLIDCINQDHISETLAHQQAASRSLKETHAKLVNFNEHSNARYADMAKQFENHTRLLKDMKSDLENVYRRVRTLKSKIASTYPSQFEKVPKPTIRDNEEG